MKSTIFNSDITPLQGFSSGETDFYFHQFLSHFLRFSFSNFLLFYLYNIFAVYFSGSSFLLKSYSSTKTNFSYLLTSALSLSSNSATTFFIFSKLSFFFYILLFAVNLFHHTKYFTTSLIFLLFKIFSTFYSSTSSTSTGFTSSTFYSSTCSLYLTT